MTVKTRKTSPDGRQLAYIEWYLSEYRNPRTKIEWAAAHDINKDTITEWERADWFNAVVDTETSRAKATWAEALASLRTVIKNPDHPQFVAAFDKLARVMGKYAAEKHEISGKTGLLEWLGSTEADAPRKRAN